MSAKKTAVSLTRQMTVIGLLGCFIAIGYARLSHFSSPGGMMRVFLLQGGIGFGIGALLGLVMYQFRNLRISTGKPSCDLKKDEAESGESDKDQDTGS